MGADSILPATLEDARALAARMRPEDAAECRALGLEPLVALQISMAHTPQPWALRLGGELAAVFGVVPGPFLAFEGQAWLLTADTVDRRRTGFWRASRAVLDVLLGEHHSLSAYVDVRYEKALRWARRLGFEVFPAEPLGRDGVMFSRIVRRRV